MTWFIITVPLMVLATAIAVVPVLYHSVREHNLLVHGSPTRPKPASQVYTIRTAEMTGPDHMAA
jgi:hypothetical protein